MPEASCTHANDERTGVADDPETAGPGGKDGALTATMSAGRKLVGRWVKELTDNGYERVFTDLPELSEATTRRGPVRNDIPSRSSSTPPTRSSRKSGTAARPLTVWSVQRRGTRHDSELRSGAPPDPAAAC